MNAVKSQLLVAIFIYFCFSVLLTSSLTVDDHFLGVGHLVLQRGYFAGVVPRHVRCRVVEVERPVPEVGRGTDLEVQVQLATHIAQALKRVRGGN